MLPHIRRVVPASSATVCLSCPAVNDFCDPEQILIRDSHFDHGWTIIHSTTLSTSSTRIINESWTYAVPMQKKIERPLDIFAIATANLFKLIKCVFDYYHIIIDSKVSLL